ncbi:MAG: type II toxin-antitoxin system VapC family toxin [Aphanizomenon flos-aquae KM1D3_PB]|uniref:type II toxin-antitoxin system VapC family toxin n=1 Tax=Aphanizomenon flos-aquae TaxID=1176 RepID=UPI0005422B4A|nr:PIN domain-containing protein [Aphanizomenon flos-aquae]KHG39731.1 twitching motility protein PilT [Aphanizomenon flos-aquae 2012/KM1/D3]QSV71263.1 MAG: type II toxin-antitoxin system VapC family toxin [Aphanizomenon flos-aquae KM1D3_PB]
MQWIEQLQGQTVALDTAPLIYFIEQNPEYIERVRLFFRALNNREFKVITSVVTLLEVLVYPLRRGDIILSQQYRDILFEDEEILKVIELSPDIAEIAAQLRAVYNLHSLDAIQMATAIYGGASFFLTNDIRLPSLPGLTVFVLNNLIS